MTQRCPLESNSRSPGSPITTPAGKVKEFSTGVRFSGGPSCGIRSFGSDGRCENPVVQASRIAKTTANFFMKVLLRLSAGFGGSVHLSLPVLLIYSPHQKGRCSWNHRIEESS